MPIFSLESAKLLFKTARQMGLRPVWLNDDGLFQIAFHKRTYYFFHSYNYLNSQLAMQLARNKYLTRNIIESNRLPNISYLRPKTKKELADFIKKHKIVVAKPLLGFRATGVSLIRTLEDASDINFEDYIFEKFIEGRELRYLVLNGEVIAVHEKINKGLINDPLTVLRVSYPKIKWNKELTEISLSITQSMDLRFAAVDFLIDKNTPYILEINSAPGLYKFQKPTSGPKINVAKLFIEATLETFKNTSKKC